MKILIGADLVPTESNVSLFCEGDVNTLFGQEICALFSDSDLGIVNLETPLTAARSPIDKAGPCLAAPPEAVNAYRALGVNLVATANNHILDQGVQGLESTWAALSKAGIQQVGTGKSQKDCEHSRVIAACGRRIGVYACTEHEFSIAGTDTPGANPFDPFESFDHVAALKARSDMVIVMYHGGREHYRYPSPLLQRTCRKFVEKGASLVICQHSHCVGCTESWRGGQIIYGQGNFLFDHSEREEWRTGLLLSINENCAVGYIPLIKKDNCVRLAEGDAARQILDGFYSRSEQIRDGQFIQKQYQALAVQEAAHFMDILHGETYRLLPVKALNKLSRGTFRKKEMAVSYPKDTLLAIEDYVMCEAHRELLLAILKQRMEK